MKYVYFFLMKYNVKAIQLRLPSQFYIFFKEDRSDYFPTLHIEII